MSSKAGFDLLELHIDYGHLGGSRLETKIGMKANGKPVAFLTDAVAGNIILKCYDDPSFMSMLKKLRAVVEKKAEEVVFNAQPKPTND